MTTADLASIDASVPDAAVEPERLRAATLRPFTLMYTAASANAVPFVAVLLAIGASVAAVAWSAHTHSMLLYGDARAHLDVARRVTDGLRTGPSQLGSVWLPIPHILMVPFTAIRPLWHSGAAGAIVSGACYLYATTRVFTLVEEITHDRLAAWVGFILFAANLDFLYLQTTALTEPVLLAFLVGATYHLARWMRTLSVRELVWSASLTMLATLTRYEGWAYLLAASAVVIVWSKRADRRRDSTEASVVVYGAVGGYGIALWFIYNLTIFHDALYFLHSPYSAQVMNGGYAQFGLLGTKGHIVESVLTYGWDVLDVIRPAVIVAAGISIALVIVMRHPERARSLFVLALLAAPALFEIVSLYVGQTTIRVPQRPPHEMYNDRYALMALPLCAVAIAIVVGRRRWLGAALALVAAAGMVAATFGTPLTIADGRHGTSSATGGHPEIAAHYLHAHYRGGEVLADDSEASNTVFAADLDLKEFVTPGSHPFWERAITEPARHVSWAIAIRGDAISRDLAAHGDRFAGFRLVLTDGDLRLFKRVEPAATS
jgi:hypothetical protein